MIPFLIGQRVPSGVEIWKRFPSHPPLILGGHPVLAYTMQVHKASSYWLPLLRLVRVLRP